MFRTPLLQSSEDPAVLLLLRLHSATSDPGQQLEQVETELELALATRREQCTHKVTLHCT